MAKNVLLNTHSVSPFMALYGRQPNLLKDFENPTASEVAGGADPVQRLREIAISTLLEGTAHDRLQRALRSKSRPAGQSLDLKIGDLVDFWRAP